MAPRRHPGKKPYRLIDVKSIVEQTGFKASKAEQSNLKDRLNALGQWYLVSIETQVSPSPSDLINQFTAIGNASIRLLQNLEATNDTEQFDGMPDALKNRLMEEAASWAAQNPKHDLLSNQSAIEFPGEENPIFLSATLLRQSLSGVAFLKELSSEIVKSLENEVKDDIHHNQVGQKHQHYSMKPVNKAKLLKGKLITLSRL